MRSSLKRALTTTGALVLAAGAVVLPATAARADGDYHGTWKLTAWNINGVTIPCPGKLKLPPPAPSISCSDHEKLVLKDNYRYTTTLKVLAHLHDDSGDYAVLKFADTPDKVIVFEANVAGSNPRSYRLRLIGAKAGTPNKMKISLSTTNPDGSKSIAKMIFMRVS